MKVREDRKELMAQAKRRKVEAMRRKMQADYPLGREGQASAEPAAAGGGKPFPLPRC